uniref:Phosphodiesterase n=1 Tax=Phallusia mammillata TaxID=59560 RepID=A0A6F9DMR5_9ASCI|nr:high affinity cAMP-specific and IBMX-insensitive 3',5'-cyclic phosphodiesterase 8B [Phallusia mammillata]
MGCSTSLLMCGCNFCVKKKPEKSKKIVVDTTEKNGNIVFSKHPDCKTKNCTSENNNTVQSKHYLSCKGKTEVADPWLQDMASLEDGSSFDMIKDLQMGSMKISKPKLKALIIFSKEDDQSRAIQTILTRHGYRYNVECKAEDAVDCFSQHQHLLVFIDCRDKNMDGNAICRSIRGKYLGNFSTIVGVIRRRYRNVHSSSLKLPCFLNCDFYKRNQIESVSNIRESLKSGFSRIINETVKLDELEDEILQLETGHLSYQIKFRSCQAIFTALERSRDSVQITDENHQIQYVNRMYERMTGFAAKQVLGRNLSEYIENEKNEEDTWERIVEEVQNGKEWEGFLYTKSKTGEDIQLHVIVLPLTIQNGCPSQYVVISRIPSHTSTMQDLTQFVGVKRKNSYEWHRRASGAAEQLLSRRLSASSSYEGEAAHKRTNSLAKIHSMAIEAPITQIINLINVVKENSHSSVTEVLDQILEILRNSELYSPADLQNRTRDPMLTDFVEGLVTGTGFSHRRSSGGENLLGRTPPSSGSSTKTTPSNITSATAVDPKIAVFLENIDSWDYDILALERVTLKKPLVHLGMHTLNQFNACEVLSCSQTTLHTWLVAIESKYHSSNTYHNSTHAADVLHATAFFLKKERLKNWMDPADEIAALLAAIIHDVDHPGRTNAFLINSNNPLALLYNDTAVLESHHAAFAFKFTVNNEKCNIFKNMTRDSFMGIRQSIVDMVLATELSKHFEHVNKFISIVTKNNNSSTSPLDHDGVVSNRSSAGQNTTVTHELRTLIKRVMIKVADVINPARKTPLCVEWARRISEEYFAQTDEEKRLGLPVVMPHFDRNTCSMPKSQLTFIDYFLTDMCDAWHEFCGMDDVMANLNDNYNYWKKLQDRGIMRLAELEDEKYSELDFTTYEASRRNSGVSRSDAESSQVSRDHDVQVSVDQQPVENHLSS